MRRTLLIVLCLYASPSFADWFDDFAGSRLVVGVTTTDTDLSVQDPNDAFNVYGELTYADFGYRPLLALYTPDVYLNESSRWGWFVELGWNRFDLRYQQYPSNPALEPQDLGTSASGNFFHLTPVLFYNWGDRHIGDDGGQSFKFGIGLGFGYLDARGNIIFTETTSALHNFNVGGFGMAINVMMDYRYNNWYIRAIGGGPAITRNGNEYELFDFAMDFGYIFTL